MKVWTSVNPSPSKNFNTEQTSGPLRCVWQLWLSIQLLSLRGWLVLPPLPVACFSALPSNVLSCGYNTTCCWTDTRAMSRKLALRIHTQSATCYHFSRVRLGGDRWVTGCACNCEERAHFAFSPAAPLLTLALPACSTSASLAGMQGYPMVVFMCVSLITEEDVIVCLPPICLPPVKCLFKSFDPFCNWVICLLTKPVKTFIF